MDRTEWPNNNKMRVERPPQGKRLGDLDYKSGQSLIPGETSFKNFGLSFLILKLTSIIFKTLIIYYAKAFDCVDHYKLWKILKEIGNHTTWPASWETYMQVRKQQLELDMEQQTGSK